jgi:hypothetical protein
MHFALLWQNPIEGSSIKDFFKLKEREMVQNFYNYKLKNYLIVGKNDTFEEFVSIYVMKLVLAYLFSGALCDKWELKKVLFNGEESTVNRALGGSTYPG